MFVNCFANETIENSVNRFKKILSLKGFPITKAEKELESILNYSERDFQQYITDKRHEIVQFHLNNNRGYSEFFETKKFESWDDIPVMTKADLQKPLADRLSMGYSTSKVFVNKTSGSSGNPFIFAKDKYAHALTWAHIIWLYQQHGIDMNSSLEARFYGIPKDFKGYQKERLKDLLANRHRFDIFDLSEHNLHKFLELFQKKPFDYINGYTSSIVLFAKFLKEQNIVLKSVCPTLKLCITTSEMLFEKDRKLLENQLGVKVVNEYGASELDVIAFENTKGEWQLNNKTLYVEIVDDYGFALPNGEEGNIVITSLYNRAHPFIRYQIGDRGVIDEASTDSNQILKSLTGRTNEFALLPSGKKVPALSFYYVTKSVIEDSGLVKEIKIIQEDLSKFAILYKAETELDQTQKQKIIYAVETYLEKGLSITFERKDELERSKSGKLKQFTSQLNS
ncbi:phenylacetate--CoA ligase family protein [Psychroflexus montanilacus]|uniref:phenylacetate--CoA ligase family protein n=1 Tax=Psychroflexus montanilacus TaxID=2873598 RepID=UPI001CC93F07|nr:phenylacetate--CoA ligase family protein [Psychroflexus montanilacus]MBZ9652710.1 phenylacetate--CoA ligase family protein [Psychroflexus montanilacus]